MSAIKCPKCSKAGTYSIHGKCQCGYSAPKRYNVGGAVSNAIPVGEFTSKRAAARASRALGNDGGGVRKG